MKIESAKWQFFIIISVLTLKRQFSSRIIKIVSNKKSRTIEIDSWEYRYQHRILLHGIFKKRSRKQSWRNDSHLISQMFNIAAGKESKVLLISLLVDPIYEYSPDITLIIYRNITVVTLL